MQLKLSACIAKRNMYSCKDCSTPPEHPCWQTRASRLVQHRKPVHGMQSWLLRDMMTESCNAQRLRKEPNNWSQTVSQVCQLPPIHCYKHLLNRCDKAMTSTFCSPLTLYIQHNFTDCDHNHQCPINFKLPAHRDFDWCTKDCMIWLKELCSVDCLKGAVNVRWLQC
jgi:hypothetical protein